MSRLPSLDDSVGSRSCLGAVEKEEKKETTPIWLILGPSDLLIKCADVLYFVATYKQQDGNASCGCAILRSNLQQDGCGCELSYSVALRHQPNPPCGIMKGLLRGINENLNTTSRKPWSRRHSCLIHNLCESSYHFDIINIYIICRMNFL